MWAGMYALNGNGEMTGTHWIHDGGYFVGPVCITNTHSVGIVHHAATRWMIRTYASTTGNGDHLWAMPVVAETYDGVLNDINGQHLARGGRPRGAGRGRVGSGGGRQRGRRHRHDHLRVQRRHRHLLATASRSTAPPFHVGTLVQANHGLRPWLTILGKRCRRGDARRPSPRCGARLDHRDHRHRSADGTAPAPAPRQARRASASPAAALRAATTPATSSSPSAPPTAAPCPSSPVRGERWRRSTTSTSIAIYLAAVEAIEEAVVNAMLAAEDMTTLRPLGPRLPGHRRGAAAPPLRGRDCHFLKPGRPRSSPPAPRTAPRGPIPRARCVQRAARRESTQRTSFRRPVFTS